MAWYDEYDKSLDSKFNNREEDEAVAQLAEDVEREEMEEPQLIPSVQTAENSNPFLGGGFSQLWSNNDDDAYIQTLKQEADDANAAAKTQWQSMGDIANDWMETKQRRAAEIKPRYTQQELDDRRAKSTAVSMLTSALANIANGIAVGTGGLNATVPDGYKAAYEHWNDVQKRHDARQAEYDKLTDAYYTTKYGMSKAEYDRLQAEAKTKEGYLYRAQEQEQKARDAVNLENQRATNKANQTILGGQVQMAVDDNRSQNTQTEIKTRHQYPTTRSTGGGGGGKGSKKAPATSFDYSSKTHGHVRVQFPQGMDEEEAYDIMADAAIAKLNNEIEILRNEVVKGKTTEKQREKAIAELENTARYKQLEKQLSDLQSSSASGTLYQRGKAIANSDISQKELEEALGIQPQQTQENKTTKTNNAPAGGKMNLDKI